MRRSRAILDLNKSERPNTQRDGNHRLHHLAHELLDLIDGLMRIPMNNSEFRSYAVESSTRGWGLLEAVSTLGC